MKIGVYVQTWHVGGVAAFCARLAQGLHALGHSSLLILATPHGKRDPAGRAAYEQLLGGSPFPIVCLHLNAFHPKERAWRAADQIAGLNCDALILNAHGPLAGTWAHLRSTTAIIGVAHNDDEYTYAEFRACQAYCDAYAGVSSEIVQHLKLLSERKPPLLVAHIPGGVPIQAVCNPGPQSGEARVLTACRLEQGQKRVLDLPLIWQQYLQRGGKATLTVCGSGSEEARLRQALAKEIEAGQVSLAGAVLLEKMPAVYARHDVLLSVSAYEGLPLSVLEAAAEGLYPVLSRIRSGHQEIIECLKEGRLCAVGDVADFATTLLEVTADPARIRQLRPRLRERARARFGLERMVEAYAELAAEVVRRRGADGFLGTRPPVLSDRPRVDFLRRFLRRWRYSRHYGWRE